MKRWTSVTTTTPIITSPIVLDEEKCYFNDGALSNEPTSKTFQTFDLATQVPVEVNVLPVATPAPEMTAKKPLYGSYGEITDETVQVQGSGSSAGDAIKTDQVGSTDSDKKEPSAFTADVLQQSNHVQDNSADSPSISSFKPQQTEQASNAVISNNNGSPQTKGTPKRLNYVQIIASKKNDPLPSQSSHTSSAGPNSRTPSAQTTPSHVILTHDAPAPSIRSKRSNSSPSTNEVLYENSSSVRLMNLLMKQSTLPAMLPPINSTDNRRLPSHDYVNYEPITELSTNSTSSLQHLVDAEQSTQQNKSKGPPPSTKPKPSSSGGKALLQNNNEKEQQQQFQQQQRSRFLSHPGPIAHLVKTGEGDEHIYLSPRQAGGNSSLPYKPYKELDFTTLDPESDYAVPKRLLENDDENDYCVPPQPVPVDSTDVFY